MPTSILGPWLASHALGIAFLALALKWTVPARWVLSGAFLVASIFSATLAVSNPGLPVGLARWAVDAWATFLTGPFAAHPVAFLLAASLALALIAALLVVGRERLSRTALFAATLVFIGVAPLGFGAAFPATLLLALGAVLLARSDLRQSLIDEIRAYHPPPRHPVHTIAEMSHPTHAGRLGHVGLPRRFSRLP